MKRKILNFVRALVGLNHINARFDALEGSLGQIYCAIDKLSETTTTNPQQLDIILEQFSKTTACPPQELKNLIETLAKTTTEAPRQIEYSASKPLADHPLLERLVQIDQLSSFGGHRFEPDVRISNAIGKNAVFILGFGRSSTTITQQILNTADNMLILAEANFYEPIPAAQRFCDWFNSKHKRFNNQIHKGTHVADFLPGVDHDWYDWLWQAAQHYEYVGDKMAFASYNFSRVAPEKILGFYEARFWEAKYIFLIRSPDQTLLSHARLGNFNDDNRMRSEISAWLNYIKLWAGWVRTFPNTTTIIAEELSSKTIRDLEEFLDVSLADAEQLLDKRQRHTHTSTDHFPSLRQTDEKLQDIFATVCEAVHAYPVMQHNEQNEKLANDAESAILPIGVSVAHQHIVHVWRKVEKLLAELQ